MKELDIRRLKVKEVLLKCSFTKTYFHDIAGHRILLIFVMEEENFNYYRKQMSNCIQRVREQLLQQFGIEVQFACGELCSQLLDLTYSIQQELQILDYAQINGEHAYELWNPEIMDKQYGVFYPREWEYRLMNFSKDGNEEKVTEILKNLQIENFIRRKLTPGMLKVFLNQLYGTLIRIMQEVSIEGEEIYRFGDRLNNQNDFYGLYDESFSFIIDSFIHICRVINERKKTQSIRLMKELCQFIQENYADKNLSLLVVAKRFNYSPAYLSLFFKEQMGNHFSSYLEEVRLNHAVNLLVNTNLSVSEIADAVGYNSSNSFCRAFRRRYGMSPGQYRRIHRDLSRI
ncbi:YesN/AraC family two-component response regulator [Caldicoprobacter guelmensis]|uniref:helix-turn-helix transcriptional regulator n=1 Tax=Caldicoprobacter guelmensis TaxID=1170224 RepID=UPI0019583852|nr:AraC family transcriptional regulator [Caldicoprobacter guelmensis]MBM7583371.1 YesN/AraC family two-component response regulator [Caldicoprobacter guelmensis]